MSNSKENLIEAGFDLQSLNHWKKRRMFFRGSRFLLIFILVASVLILFTNYLANLPRERHAKRSGYLERVKLGSQKFLNSAYLTLIADQEDPFTKLPTAEIFIKGYRLDRLNANLPESGRQTQKASFKYNNQEYKVDARYRGDSMNHWALPQKSWRIIAKKSKLIDQAYELNLNVPRVENQISNWLGYEMARSFGDILVPDSDLVHFRLNRRYDGVRLLLEQPNLEFIAKRDLPPGKIYIGDISTEQIYGGEARKPLYIDSSAWNVVSATPDESKREIANLLRVVGQEHNPYRFYYKMNQLLDIKATLKYIAMLELVGSVHVDSNHNGKYFFNPYSGKFTPIAWDTVAYFWGDSQPLDLAPNPLFRVLLSNPEFREMKDRYLWQAINGELSDENLLQKIKEITFLARNDIYSFALKLHANDKGIRHLTNQEWEQAVQKLEDTVLKRNKRIQDHIKNNDVTYNFVKYGNKVHLVVKTNSAVGAKLGSINLLKLAPNVQATLSRRGLKDLLKPVSPEIELVQAVKQEKGLLFNINDSLFSKRRHIKRQGFQIVPGVYVYEIKFDSEVKDLDFVLKLNNSITGKRFKAKRDETLTIPEAHKANSVWWSPENFISKTRINFSGLKKLQEDLILDPWTELNIAAGSTIVLGPDVSIIADGGVININGESGKPVTIKSTSNDQPWGVIAGLNGAKLNIQHAKFINGSSTQYGMIRFDAPLSLHYAEASIESSEFDNYIASKYSELTINNSVFNTIYEYPVSVENSTYREKNNQYKTQKVVHSFKDINQEALGTAGRWEREFKYTFKDLDVAEQDPIELADEIRLALIDKINTPGFWSVSKQVPDTYYADQKVKDFIFRDIYFDNQDRINHKYGVSYRYRNRYPSENAYQYHNKDYYRARFWPYRLEFQAKTQREELEGGYSRTLESRFEFRKESAPFSEARIPPAAPWDPDYFIPDFKSGHFDGKLTHPGKSILEFFKDKVDTNQDLNFEPSSVLLTMRYRQHLNIKTPWGSGPNPEQAYIISLDHSKVYDANSYLRFLETRRLGNKKYPEPEADAHIVEIEVEFERNISDQLDRDIEQAKTDGDQEKLAELTKARDAFIEDQNKIMQVIKDYFAEKQIVVEPIGKSKYVQAMDLLGW